MAALQAGSAFKLRHIRQVSRSAAVAAIAIGPVSIGSIWVNDIQGEPEVNWPRTLRGFPLVNIDDNQLRLEIEAAILAAVKDWTETEGRAGA